MQRFAWIILALLIFVVRYFWNSPGSKVEFKNNCTVYYKSGVTEADAKAVGTFLEKMDYFGGQSADVQMVEKDGKIQLRFVVQKSIADSDATSATINMITAEARALALGNRPVEAVLVDENLKELKTMAPLDLGKGLALGKGTLFYTDAAGEESAKRLVAWAVKEKLEDEIWQLDKKGDTYKLSMVFGKTDEATKPEVQGAYAQAAVKISKVLGAPTEIDLVTMGLKPLKIIPAPAVAKATEQPKAGAAESGDDGAPAETGSEATETETAAPEAGADEDGGDAAKPEAGTESPAPAEAGAEGNP